MVAVFELFQKAVKLAVQPLGHPHSEDLGHGVGGQAEQPHFTGALEDFADRKVPFENEIAAVLDLVEGIASTQVDGLSVFG